MAYPPLRHLALPAATLLCYPNGCTAPVAGLAPAKSGVSAQLPSIDAHELKTEGIVQS